MVQSELKFDQDLLQVRQSDNYMQLISNTPLKMRKEGSQWNTKVDILRMMMRRWQMMHTAMIIAVTILIVLCNQVNIWGRDFLKCSEHSDQHWVDTDLAGRVFGFLHIFIILICTLQAERAFYSIPHKMGYFEHPVQPVDELQETVEQVQTEHNENEFNDLKIALNCV